MSVQYNVSTLLQEPVGSVREQVVDSQVRIDDETPCQRITGHTTFLRTKDGVLVTADLEGVQREQCSRCLQEVAIPLRLKIREEFLSSVDPETGAALPLEDPEAHRIDANHMLDLEEAIRQSWTTVLPMQPLCRPDCAGLCPRCGQDLNGGACSCLPEADERWSALGALAREMKGK